MCIRRVCHYIKAVSGVDLVIDFEADICVIEGEAMERNRHISSSGADNSGSVDGTDSVHYRMAVLSFCGVGPISGRLENDGCWSNQNRCISNRNMGQGRKAFRGQCCVFSMVSELSKMNYSQQRSC